MSPNPISQQPPLGLVPKHIADEHFRNVRREQIAEAVVRYFNDGQTPIPVEWIAEYNDLLPEENRT